MEITTTEALPLSFASKYGQLAPGHILETRAKRKHVLAMAFVGCKEISDFITAVDDLTTSIDLTAEMSEVIQKPDLMELYCALGALAERRTFYAKNRNAAVKSFCDMNPATMTKVLNNYYFDGLPVIVDATNPSTNVPAVIIEWLNVRNHDQKIRDVISGVHSGKLKIHRLSKQET